MFKFNILKPEQLYEYRGIMPQYTYILLEPDFSLFYDTKRKLDPKAIVQSHRDITNNISNALEQKGLLVDREYLVTKDDGRRVRMIACKDLPDSANSLIQNIINAYKPKKKVRGGDKLQKRDLMKTSTQLYNEMKAQLNSFEDLDISWIDYSTGNEKSLYEHQARAVNFAMQKKRALLDLATGSGKTLISLVCARNVNRKYGKKTLILCEKKAIVMWQEESQGCGVSADIVNFEQVQNIQYDVNEYSCIIVDESHTLSNYTRSGLAVLKYTKEFSGYMMSLTATPFRNSISDYFYHFELLKHPVGKYSITEFESVINKDKINIKRFCELSKDMIMTLTYEDIGLNTNIDFQRHLITIDKDSPFWDQYNEIMNGPSSSASAKIMRVRRLCAIYKAGYATDIAKELDKQCIIVSSFNDSVLDDMSSNLGVGVYKATNKNKDNLYKDFINGRTNVFLAQRKIAETSLNLQVCDTIIYNDLWYSLASFVQSNGRIKRIGSRFEELYAHIPIIKGTVEEDIFNILTKKYKERNYLLEGLQGFEQRVQDQNSDKAARIQIENLFNTQK